MSIDTGKAPPGIASSSTSEPEHDLKSLPMAEVQQQLGSSPEGLTQVEAASGWRRTARRRSPSTRRTRC